VKDERPFYHRPVFLEVGSDSRSNIACISRGGPGRRKTNIVFFLPSGPASSVKSWPGAVPFGLLSSLAPRGGSLPFVIFGHIDAALNEHSGYRAQSLAVQDKFFSGSGSDSLSREVVKGRAEPAGDYHDVASGQSVLYYGLKLGGIVADRDYAR